MTSALFGKFKLAKVQPKKYPCHDQINDFESTVKKRRKNGCFSCRKRRIKCLGSKPECDNCLKSSYVCIWPDGNKSLPHNSTFQLKKKKPLENNTNNNIHEIKNETATDDNNNYHLVKTSNEIKETIQDALFRKVIIEINSSAFLQLRSSSVFNGLSRNDFFLLDGFVNGFITDITPQLTHFKLQPGSAFIPTCINQSIVQDIFYSCGASFLYLNTQNQEMKMISDEKFKQSTKKLHNYVNSNKFQGNETWIIVYLLLSYLKLRFIFKGQRTSTLRMITATEAIKMWIMSKQNKGNLLIDSKKIIEISNDEFENSTSNIYYDLESNFATATEKGIFENPSKYDFDDEIDFTFTHLRNKYESIKHKYESENDIYMNFTKSAGTNFNLSPIKNEMYEIIGNSNNEVIPKENIFPYEKTMLDSFICNYTNSIFTCEKELMGKMTSPFIIFDLLKPYISVPIYKCAVPWMNHPVVGAALPCFELQAKVCWLGLYPKLTSQQTKILESLRNSAKYYTSPILPIDVYKKEPEYVQRKLMESCYAAELMSKAVFIYATKLLNREEKMDSFIIQEAVEKAYQALKKITIQSHVHMILCFSLVVIGSVSIKQTHRDFLSWKLEKLCEVFKFYTFKALKSWLRKAWSEPSDRNSLTGWDMLFDPESIKCLVF